MPFDYSKLDGRIVEKFKTRGKFANALAISERSLSLKMNGKVAWTQPEIYKSCELLNIKDDEIKTYFFSIKVQRI